VSRYAEQPGVGGIPGPHRRIVGERRKAARKGLACHLFLTTKGGA
jgi:hypothetical protein